MRATLVHWLVVLLLLSGGLPAEFLVESPVKHAAEEEPSSERQDDSFKSSALRKRSARAKRTKLPRTTLSATPVWSSYVPFADDHRLSFSPPATSSNLNLHQLHQIFRI
jgi:hypothetical protein